MFHPTQTAITTQLLADAEQMRDTSMRDLFAEDPSRATRYHLELDDLYIDYSKQCITDSILQHLEQLAETAQLPQWREHLFQGKHINQTEDRAVLHMALRAHPDEKYADQGQPVMAEVEEVRQRLYTFADSVRDGSWRGATGKAIDTIVNIGIGGSELGPRLVCEGLRAYAKPSMKAHFMTRLDATHVEEILRSCDAETTLFIVASKTFTTIETIENAKSARAWLVAKLGESAVSKHFVAVSTNTQAVTAFGILAENRFGFWDWVGGRYSVWSAVGLSAIILLGSQHFAAFLEGARAMDQHFRHAPLAQNIPVTLALLGIWNSNFLGCDTQAILSYDECLAELANYLQQQDMESNGKQTAHDGAPVRQDTGPILWGGLGNSGQHAFYQLLHQGTRVVPIDFIAPLQPTYAHGDHHAMLLANCFAQSEALMRGKTAAEADAELKQKGMEQAKRNELVPFKTFSGNRPSTTILYDKLTPRMLGMLIAMYEHKVFVQGILWDINSFDQWGVELGKELASRIIPELTDGAQHPHDSSTAALIARYNQRK